MIDGDKTVSASFSRIMHSLSISVNGNGSITPVAGVQTYAEGDTVQVIATSDTGWQFDSWSGGVSNPDSATTTVLIDGDKTIIANFSQAKPWGMIIGIIAAALGAGLGTLFATRRKKAKAKAETQ